MVHALVSLVIRFAKACCGRALLVVTTAPFGDVDVRGRACDAESAGCIGVSVVDLGEFQGVIASETC